MRACPTCGASNGSGDDFCGNCGAYLGWSDTTPDPGTPSAPAASPEPTPPDPAPEPAPPPADEPSPADPPRTSSLYSRLTGRSGGRAGGATGPDAPGPPSGDGEGRHTDEAPHTGEAPHTDEESATAAPTAGADRVQGTGALPAGASPSAVGSPPDTGTPRAAAPPGPRPPAAPAPGTPAPDPVLPVRPAKAVAPRPVVRPVAEPEAAEGAPCPACGTPNLPDRRFCRRCATPLNPAAKAAPLPWWRTVWPFRRRARASSGRVVRGLVILAVVVALCAGGFLLLPAGRALVEDTRDKLSDPKPVTPVDIAASAEIPGHPAKNTTDGLNNRYWGAPGPRASVTYTFSKPFRLLDLIIINGPSASPEAYARQGRALQVDLEVTTEDGDKHRKRVTLSDKPGQQPISTGISDVKTVRLVMSSPTGLSKGRHLALAEVEFFQRS
ncbi:zinc ribbon domain-containing protein [Streptomyces sp. NPDC058221]|uniref:NADase-type glycan-binding domain-containing protein n=1 Tax=Streptomyces sp. NPDC058221 TaxID=3346388 RepID=UPI0036DFF244